MIGRLFDFLGFRKKLFLAFSFVSVLFSIATVLAVISSRQTYRLSIKLEEKTYLGQQMSQQLISDFRYIGELYSAAIATKKFDNIGKAKKEADWTQATLDRLEQLLVIEPEKIKNQRTLFNSYMELGDQAAGSARTSSDSRAMALELARLNDASASLIKSMYEIDNSIRDIFLNDLRIIGQLSNRTTVIAIAATLFALLLAAKLSVFVTARITKPIFVLMSAMERVGKGELRAEIPVSGKDEITILSQNYNMMLSGLRDRERMRDIQKQVFEITRALYEQMDIDIMLNRTLLTTMSAVDALAGSILLYDEKKDALVFKYVVGEAAEVLKGTSIKPDQGIAGQVFQSGKTKLVRDTSQESQFLQEVDRRTGFQSKNMITTALKSIEGQPIGVIQIIRKKEGFFNDEDIRIVEIMAILATTAIQNVRFHENERLAAVATMVGQISHDLKNMLTPIILGVDLLKMMLQKFLEKLPEALRNKTLDTAFSRLAIIKEASVMIQERMKAMTNCVKGIVSDPLFERASINEVARRVIEILRANAQDKGIELEHIEGQVPEFLMDTKQIYNALYNLLDNSIAATPRGGKVQLETYCSKGGTFPQESAVVIQISDTGCGIPNHVLERLFTDKAISTKAGGTGFGTQIVANVVKAHKGKLEVKTKEGHGTTFIIRIPL